MKQKLNFSWTCCRSPLPSAIRKTLTPHFEACFFFQCKTPPNSNTQRGTKTDRALFTVHIGRYLALHCSCLTNMFMNLAVSLLTKAPFTANFTKSSSIDCPRWINSVHRVCHGYRLHKRLRPTLTPPSAHQSELLIFNHRLINFLSINFRSAFLIP